GARAGARGLRVYREAHEGPGAPRVDARRDLPVPHLPDRAARDEARDRRLHAGAAVLPREDDVRLSAGEREDEGAPARGAADRRRRQARRRTQKVRVAVAPSGYPAGATRRGARVVRGAEPAARERLRADD